MPSEAEVKICTAPSGMYRIVYIDPRDNFPVREVDVSTIIQARAFIGNKPNFTSDNMAVFDENGHRVAL